MKTIRAFNRRLLSTLFTSCAIIVLMPGPISAQAVKPAPAKKTRPTVGKTRPGQSHKLTPANLESRTYQIWLAYYQAQLQGQQPSVPVLNIPDSVDATEANRVMAVWQQ